MRSPFPVKPSLMTLIRAIRSELQKISKCLRAWQKIVDHWSQSACADTSRSAFMTFDRFHVVKLMNERLDDLRRNRPKGP